MSPAIHDRRPPRWLTKHVANPVVCAIARTRWGHRLPVAVLSFVGRRTGRRYDVPVGVHEAGQERLVFTDALWRLNFRGGAPAELLVDGQRRPVHVTLVEQSAEVGEHFRAVLRAGVRPAQIAMRIPAGYEPSNEEYAAHRKVLRLSSTPA